MKKNGVSTVTLPAHPSVALLSNLFASLIAIAPQSSMPEGQTDNQTVQPIAEQAPQTVVHLAAKPEPEAVNAYYADSPIDEEGGAAVEAHLDFVMGDLELLY